MVAVRLERRSTAERGRRLRREGGLRAATVEGRGGRRSSSERRSGARRRCRRRGTPW